MSPAPVPSIMPSLPTIPVLTEESDFKEWKSRFLFLANTCQFLPLVDQPLAEIEDMSEATKRSLTTRAKEALFLNINGPLRECVTGNFQSDDKAEIYTLLAELEKHFGKQGFHGKALAWSALQELNTPSITSNPIEYSQRAKEAFINIAANGREVPAADQIAWISGGLRSLYPEWYQTQRSRFFELLSEYWLSVFKFLAEIKNTLLPKTVQNTIDPEVSFANATKRKNNRHGRKSNKRQKRMDGKPTNKWCSLHKTQSHTDEECNAQKGAQQNKEQNKPDKSGPGWSYANSTLAFDTTALGRALDTVGLGQTIDDAWFVDSGASFHMTPRRDLLQGFTPAQTSELIQGSGGQLEIKGHGQILKTGTDVSFKRKTLTSPNGHTMGTLREACGIYLLNGRAQQYSIRSKKALAAVNKQFAPHVSSVSAALWHRRLGHASPEYVKRTIEKTTGMIVSIDDLSDHACEVCLSTKSQAQPYTAIPDEQSPKLLGDRIHADLMGPITPVSQGGLQANKWLTPHESLYGKAPYNGNLVTFGATAHVHTSPEERALFKHADGHTHGRGAKFPTRRRKGYFLSHVGSRMYKVYIPDLDKIVLTRNVRFDENPMQGGYEKMELEPVSHLKINHGNKVYLSTHNAPALLPFSISSSTSQRGDLAQDFTENPTPRATGSLQGTSLPFATRSLPETRRLQDVTTSGPAPQSATESLLDTRQLTGASPPQHSTSRRQRRRSRHIHTKAPRIRRPEARPRVRRTAEELRQNMSLEEVRRLREQQKQQVSSTEQHNEPNENTLTHYTDPELPMENASSNEQPILLPSSSEPLSSIPPTSDHDYDAEADLKELESPLNPTLALGTRQVVSEDPKTYRQAQASPYAAQWLEAMREEMNAHGKMGTFTMEAPPKGAKTLPSKWVYTTKRNLDGTIARHKARWVVMR
ncbi:uncharacterized protein BROUX77_005141 [Berkeleyomyces rouxiae]|uniref:uncharacterized protein n=1 Tax=Berkeleyomyces rouxiae TaxID=2035830 RepID=UPI003B7B811A